MNWQTRETAPNWQTMETAPHEGEPVLLWGVADGSDGPWYVVATWDPGGWWLSDETGEIVSEPTWWCPIPDQSAFEETSA